MIRQILLILFLNFAKIHAISPLQLEDPRGIFHPNDAEKLAILGKMGKNTHSVRLPSNIRPAHYELFLQPILDEIPGLVQFTAPGTVRISIDVLENTRNITLHSNGPDIKSVQVSGTDGNIPVVRSYADPDDFKHFFIIELESELQGGDTYEIFMEFVAPISQTVHDGLYHGSYWDPAAEKMISYAATQMQPTHCRQLFPSFDEPHFKATFSVKIARIQNLYSSYANGDLNNTEPLPDFEGWVVDSFSTTPIMSTYLFAMFVGDFTYVEADNSYFGGKTIRTYASPDLIAKGGGDFAVVQAAKILEYLEEEFVIKYPVEKMYSFALQNFSSGGMENYGLNNYIIPFQLYFPGETIEHDRYMITILLGHELGHQWFGNLATCEWWSHTWLNEGLVSYVHYMASKAVAPEFNQDHRFITEAFQFAMQLDVSPNAHPLVNNAQTPPEIEAIFSRITYERGAVMVRMMEGFLGKETLLKGLRLHLERKQFNTAVTDDLWSIFDEVAQQDGVLNGTLTIKQIMDPWVLKSGFPLVRVSAASPDRIYLSQEKFHLDARKRKRRNAEDDLWNIPISLASAQNPYFDDTTPKLWIESQVAVQSFEISTQEWLILNPGSTGYYRVLYDSQLLDLIKAQLKEDPSVIDPINRAQLLNDYLHLAFNSYTLIENYLDLTVLLQNETSRLVWDTFFLDSRRIYNQLLRTETFNDFKKYLLPYLENALDSIGWRQEIQESGEIVIFRSQLLDWACSMGSIKCVDYANDMMDIWKDNPALNPIPVDLQRILYCTFVSAGSFEAYDFIFEKYREESCPSQRSSLASGLTCAKEVTLIQLTLENSLNEETGFQSSDVSLILEKVGANSMGSRMVFNFIREFYEEIIEVTGSTASISRVGGVLATYFNTQVELDDFKAWIEYLEEFGAPEGLLGSLKASAANIEPNIKWIEDFEYPIRIWLLHNNS